MNSKAPADTPWQNRKRLQTIRLAQWTGAWLASMALATFGPALVWPDKPLITLIAIAINLLIGVGMIIQNRDLLKSLDELERQIHLEAMAVTLGVGLIVGLAYSNLDARNVIPFDAEITHMFVLMSLTYLATMIRLNRKYA